MRFLSGVSRFIRFFRASESIPDFGGTGGQRGESSALGPASDCGLFVQKSRGESSASPGDGPSSSAANPNPSTATRPVPPLRHTHTHPRGPTFWAAKYKLLPPSQSTHSWLEHGSEHNALAGVPPSPSTTAFAFLVVPNRSDHHHLSSALIWFAVTLFCDSHCTVSACTTVVLLPSVYASSNRRISPATGLHNA